MSIDFAVTAFYCCLFVVIGAIDLKRKLILNKIVLPSMAVALIVDFFVPPPSVFDITLPWGGVVAGIVGGAVGFTFLLVPALVCPRSMGWGDVKLAGLIGLAVGFPLVLVALPAGVALGGITAGILLLLKIKKRVESIPLGPFLSLATMATLIWGSDILNWYLGRF